MSAYEVSTHMIRCDMPVQVPNPHGVVLGQCKEVTKPELRNRAEGWLTSANYDICPKCAPSLRKVPGA